MLVWWAVFFFAGALFPSGAEGARAALVSAPVLLIYSSRLHPASPVRALLTCATGLLVFVTAAHSPIDIGLVTGSGKRAPSRAGAEIYPVLAVREWMHAAISKEGLGEGTKGLLRALILADRRDLATGTRRDWRKTGTAHYLALSGLHLGLIAVPVFCILTLAGARGIIRVLAAMFVLSFYAAVAGRPGSLLRALSMLGVIQAQRLAGVRTCLVRSVMAGAFVVCILDPGTLGDTGFLLSFNAAAGVALIGAPLCRSIHRRLRVRKGSGVMLPPVLALSMSFSVQAFMLPLTVRIFGFAPLLGPLMSAVMALPVTALLYGGFAYVVAGHFWSRIAALPLNLTAALAGFLVSRGAEVSRSGLIVSDFDIRLYLPGLALCAAAFRCERYARPVLALGIALAAVSFHPAITGTREDHRGKMSLHVQDGILYGGNGGVLVLDRWPTSRSASRLTSEIRRSGVRRIGIVIVRDPGGPGAGGMSIIAEDLGPARVLVSPWHEGPCPGPVECAAVRTDTTLTVGKGVLEVRAPEVLPGRGAVAGRDEASLVISPLD